MSKALDHTNTGDYNTSPKNTCPAEINVIEHAIDNSALIPITTNFTFGDPTLGDVIGDGTAITVDAAVIANHASEKVFVRPNPNVVDANNDGVTMTGDAAVTA